MSLFLRGGNVETDSMMFYVIYRGEPVGSSELEWRDSAQSIAFGDFEPLSAYEAVHPVFLLFIQAILDNPDREQPADEQKLARYYQERDALQLTLQDGDSHLIQTSWIHVDDYGDLGREMSAQIPDARFWGKSASNK